ncbi:TSUP family transporter [Camelimonas abortus]|uniref:Probable membrane transporter protein n=1 Tax=Camelimonas abortus TaxID=1017184 RepID=A0ABV7LEH9_9HYPH
MDPGATLTAGMAGLLTGLAFLAGLIDAIAGGGGLLVLPALLLAGFQPASALAVNKLQASFGSGSATVAFTRAGLIDWPRTAPMFAMAMGGSVAGALLVSALPTGFLRAFMPPMLVAIALYMGFSPRLGDDDREQRLTPAAFTLTAAPAIGFYDGVFGPGTGSLLMLAFVGLLGLGITRATGRAKALNFASNAGALAILAVTQPIAWPLGLLMGAAAFAGARIGAGLAIRNGARLIRPLLVLACCAMALRLFLDEAGPWRALAGKIFGS